MRIITIICLIIIVASCKEKPAATSQKTNKDTTKFFEVTHFIQGQINDVNKTPYFIYSLTTINNKKDSIAINSSDFAEMAKPFLQPNINDPSLKPHYTENIFFDESTKTFTLSYTTTNKDLEVQNVDVLLKEDGETVKRILIRKFFNYSDSSAVEQLSWKPNESFQVIRLLQTLKDKTETSRQNVVVWNEKG